MHSLEDVGCDIFPTYGVLCDTFLVAAHLNYNQYGTYITQGGTVHTRDRTCRVRLLILLRPSDTTQTTTFCQPFAPHILERFLLHRCAMFLMTLMKTKLGSVCRTYREARTYAFMVRVNRTSSSLYIVMTMKSSVCRP